MKKQLVILGILFLYSNNLGLKCFFLFVAQRTSFEIINLNTSIRNQRNISQTFLSLNK